MSSGFRVLCPAKVNLFLSVGPPDRTGMHPIRTVFQAVGLFDELHVRWAERDSLTSDWPGLPPNNTVSKALRLAREHGGFPPVEVHLSKRIPAQAGLGGGSSDAAGLLRALMRLSKGAFGMREATEVARAVGADVPFFLVGGRAEGEGYGERLHPLDDEPRRWLCIVKPEVGVSTAEAYRDLDAKPREWLPLPDRADPWPQMVNDFERVAPCACLEVMDRLAVFGARGQLLCGSGSAVFGWFEQEQEARMAQRQAEAESLGRAWTVPTLGRGESLKVEPIETPSSR